jgi:hypothetical protein
VSYERIFILYDNASTGFVPADYSGNFFLVEKKEENREDIVAGCRVLAAGYFNTTCSGFIGKEPGKPI